MATEATAKDPDGSAAIRPAGRSVELFNEEALSRVRRAHGVPDTFLNEEQVYDMLKEGGGKGGALIAKLPSGFIVKELSVGDHRVLKRVAESYVDYFLKEASLLSTFYLHYRDEQTKRYFCVQRNEVGMGPFCAVYDLKGCADDKTLELDGEPVRAVHKRIWMLHMWGCGKLAWSEARKRYHQGKLSARTMEISLPQEDCKRIAEIVKRDAAWLKSNRLMDYSLLLATAKAGDSTVDRTRAGVVVHTGDQGEELVTSMSIIDFLQVWTNGKRIARGIKCCECDKATVPPDFYARRFVSRFEDRLVPRPPPIVVEIDGDKETTGA